MSVAVRASLFGRLLFAALLLIAITLFAIDYTLASAPAALRLRVFAISLGSALLALAIAYVVSLSLAGRVTRLKQFAEGLVEDAGASSAIGDSGDELRALERTMTRVADQIRNLLDRLRFESARHEAILSSMAEGVLAVDRDLRVTFCNDAFLRAIGARKPVFEQTRLLELVRDPGLLEVLGHVVNTGEARKQLLKISAAQTRSFEVQAAPLMIPSGQGAIAILYDTTDLERLEQIRKEFVANVSHELRTPLAGIIGYTDTLLDGALEDDQHNRRFLEIIRSNAVQLSSIASDLLVLSELESGYDPPEPEQISVREVLESVLLTVKAEANTRGVTLIAAEIADVEVLGFRLRLEQAVLNLVANAIKFNKPGGEVRVRTGQTADGRVTIEVADTGMGIPSQDLPRIFERFYRVDKGRSRQVGGTGLGLSIVKHVVERMNGSISVESQLGKGTTFTVTLPAA
jgi:two-component system phosphate regulon sensor histidine kinase PhoR